MKTLRQHFTQSPQSDSSQRSTHLPALSRRLVLASGLLWLLQMVTFAQSNVYNGTFWTGASYPGYLNYAGQCNPAYEPNVYAYSGSSCTTPSPWSITITDSAGTPLVVSGLHVDASLHVLRTGAGAAPSFDLTTLAVGDCTVKISDPCGNSYTFALKIVGCIGGVALVPEIGYTTQIAPNRAVTYSAIIANVGINASTLTTLEVRDIPAATDCLLTSTSMTVGTSGSGQKVSVNVGPVNPGDQKGFLFQMQATPTAIIGSTFTILAEVAAPFLTTDSEMITVVASIDPNAKYGPAGYGSRHNIPQNTALPYLVTFENDPSALAPAQIVTITDYLDTTKVEPASVQFGPVYFGSTTVTPPAGVNPFSVTVPYDVDNNPGTTADNIYVRVSGNVDQNPASGTYGMVEWMFESLDAPGGNPPPINVGFLPPNLIAPEGDGGVTFAVSQKADLAPGTLITNLASIVFDVNAPILTPVWTNRIAVPSTLGINRTQAGMVRVSWSGGVLEQASTVTANDWTNSPVQISPWTFDPTEPLKFFRVRND